MNLKELKKISVTQGIQQAVIEKDYALSIALHELANSPIKDYIVFKGGTAIKKIYFQNARFSEDLDFTVVDSERTEVLKELRTLPNVKKVFVRSGIRFDYLVNDPNETFFKELVKRSNHLGLFSEDIDLKTKGLRGNFPQAYTHIALINSAIFLSEWSVKRKTVRRKLKQGY